MAFMMKIKHVDQLANGVLRFRRRFPKDVVKALGESALQVHIKNREGVAFQREYAAILQDWQRIVDEARAKTEGRDARSPTTRWHEALLKAEKMVSEAKGFEGEPFRDRNGEVVTYTDTQAVRELLVEGLMVQGGDPLILKALQNPKAEIPKATLQDAVNIYDKERIKGDHDKRVRLDRVLRRIEVVLGPLGEMPLEELRREHGRKFRDHLLGLKKSNGEPLSIDAVKKDLTIAIAVVNLGIKELDLEGRAANPFKGQELPNAQQKRKNETKPPLPDNLVMAMDKKLADIGSHKLHQLWRLMAGTSAHAKELAHLELGDIDLEAEVLQVRHNSHRGELKTFSRDRAIPLVGESLKAARELVEDMQGASASAPLFPAYAGKPRGSDSLSRNLNKHLESLGAKPKERTYGLRHRVAARLRLAGAPQITIDRVLGHHIEAVGAATYGGVDDRLTVDREWMVKAGL